MRPSNTCKNSSIEPLSSRVRRATVATEASTFLTRWSSSQMSMRWRSSARFRSVMSRVQSLETQIATGCVEFRLTRLLEPDLTPVRANEAKKRRIGRVLNAKAPDPCSEARAILRMYTGEEIVGLTMGAPVRFEPEDLGSIFATPRQPGTGLPCESHHLTGRKRLLQPRLTLLKCNIRLLAFIDLARDLGDESGQEPPVAEGQNPEKHVTLRVEEDEALHRRRDQDSRHVAERRRRHCGQEDRAARRHSEADGDHHHLSVVRHRSQV